MLCTHSQRRPKTPFPFSAFPPKLTSSSKLDRQIRRLDIKIRDLQNEGAISIDPELPSLLKTSTLSTRPPPLSTNTTGASTPLHPLSGNAGPSTSVATGNPSTRLTHPPRAHSNRHPSPSPLSVSTIPSHLSTSAAAGGTISASTPITSSLLNPRVATRSPSSDPSKRRRLNPHLSIPPTSSNFRQASLGPGTPKSLHPLANSRSGSAGPRPPKKLPRTNPPHHQRIGHLNPSSAGAANKKPYRRRPGKKSTLGSALGHLKPSPSDTGEESALSEGDGQEGESDVEMDDVEGEGDDRKYCTCRSVSYGNMVACDNDDCPYEWFHWSCVAMTKEPAGTWFCDECRGKM